MFTLKQEMSTQLAGLLVCALQCLKGGQTFQYSSLLIVNLIIDSFTRFEISLLPFNWSRVFSTDSDHHNHHYRSNNLREAKNGSGDGANAGNGGVSSERSEKHSTAATIGKLIRNLRINESFNFKPNFATTSTGTTGRDGKVAERCNSESPAKTEAKKV